MHSLWLGPAAARCQAVSADCQDVLGAMATALPGGGRRSVAERSTYHMPGWHKCAIPTSQPPGLGCPLLHPRDNGLEGSACTFTRCPGLFVPSKCSLWLLPHLQPFPPSLGLLISTIRVTAVSIHPGGGVGPSLLIYFAQAHTGVSGT